MQTVLVLRGGIDAHDVSLKTGAAALGAFSKDSSRAIDVFIDKKGAWHVRGVPVAPEQALRGADRIFNALHGAFGEDGQVQKILERSGVPFTASGAFASALAMQKPLAKELMQKAGVRVPRHALVSESPDLEREVLAGFRSFSPPVVIKPAASGTSLGVSVAKTFESAWSAVKNAFGFSPKVMLEEYISGREATLGVVEDFRGKEAYALLPIEVVRPRLSVFDAAMKRAEPPLRLGSFTRDESAELERLARLAHETMGLRGYSRSDFIVTPRGVYFLEANSQPPLGPGTAFSASLEAVGAEGEIFEHLLRVSASK